MSFGHKSNNEFPNISTRSVFRGAPLHFKIAFGLVTLIILAAFVVMGYMLINGVVLGNGYSYNVEYEIGGIHYQESTSYGK